MAYLMASIPYFKCMVRSEYLRDLEGEIEGKPFIPATAVAVISRRADSLHFQVMLHEPYGGCGFVLPIEALATKPCRRAHTKVVQPWDSFSAEIGVVEIEALRRAPVKLLTHDWIGTYLFTIASSGSDLADDPAQRKLLHVCALENGVIGAWPNNRLVFVDRALFGDLTAKPAFRTLTKEFRAEGVAHSPQEVRRMEQPISAPPNGAYCNPEESPDWHHA